MRLNPARRATRRLIVTVVGGTVLGAGLLLLVLPGPALLVIPVGLAILATEFVWAQRLLAQVRGHIRATPQGNGADPPVADLPDVPLPTKIASSSDTVSPPGPSARNRSRGRSESHENTERAEGVSGAERVSKAEGGSAAEGGSGAEGAAGAESAPVPGSAPAAGTALEPESP